MKKVKANKLPVNANARSKNIIANGKVSKKNDLQPAKTTAKNVVASGKMSKKSVVPSDDESDDEIEINLNDRPVKNEVANGKISKRSVSSPAKVMPPKKFMEEEESDDESDDEIEINLNDRPVKNEVANGKISKRSVSSPAKVMPPKKFIKDEESDDESNDDIELNLNGKPVKKTVKDEVVKGKISKKSVVTPAKVMPPKKFTKEEESDESDDEIELNLNEEREVANDDDVDDEDDNDDEADGDDNDIDDVGVAEDADNKSENANSLIAFEDHDGGNESDSSEPEENPIKREDDIVESSSMKRSEQCSYTKYKRADNDDANDSDTSQPGEKPIKKEAAIVESSSMTGIEQCCYSKYMRSSIPDDQIILISNLPRFKTYTHADIAKVFHKYGTILSIVIFPSLQSSIAFVAYNRAAEARAALEANNTEVKNYIVNVALRIPPKIEKINKMIDKKMNDKKVNNYSPDFLSRTIYIGNVNKVTESDLRVHLKSCGNIERILFTGNSDSREATVQFENEDAVEEGLKFNGTMLNGSEINVYTKKVDGKNSVKMAVYNTKNYKIFEEAKLREIFSKCGNIQQIEMLCRFKVLAFVTFENPSDLENALKLNDTRVDDFDISVAPFQNSKFSKQSIVIQNIGNTVTNHDITEHFKDVGQIASIQRKMSSAIIEFETTDGYCKSFLLNETCIKGSPIFLKPLSRKVFNKRPVGQFKSNGISTKPHTKRPYLGKKPAVPYFNSNSGPPNKIAKPNW